MRLPVYLDHHASTPPDPRVLAKMREALEVHFGNPASATHAYGWAAASLVEAAREEVALMIGATAREIVFTSGATEANNLALKGFAAARAGAPGHVVTSGFEHEAVREPLAELVAHTAGVSRWCRPDPTGWSILPPSPRRSPPTRRW